MEQNREEKVKKEEINSIAEMFIKEEIEDKENYKVAVLIAVVMHILLITTVFPSIGAKEIQIKPKKEKKVIRVVLEPPVETLTEVILNKKKSLVPVPDPDPDKIEPKVPVDTTFKEEFEYEGEIIDMSGVEAPDIPIRPGVAGLVPPVYSVSELQRNAVYPELGVIARKEGFVIVEVVLKKDGTVGEAKVIGGLTTLGFPQSAINAVKNLSFTPGIYNDNPVDVIMVLTVHYRLKR